MPINAECRKPFLRMGSQNACKINRTRPLRSVESPYAFNGHRIHIHRFRTIAPARRYGQCNGNPFFFKLLCTCCRFAHAPDCRIRNNYFYRLTIGIFQVFGKQLCCRFRHIHCLVFQRFPYLQIPSSSVNGRPNTNYRIIPNHSVLCHLAIPPSPFTRFVFLI